ncbi:hypothetical protein ACEPPN_009495 [Leptodophora sp. 'Broadleaf-Isolate-01']
MSPYDRPLTHDKIVEFLTTLKRYTLSFPKVAQLQKVVICHFWARLKSNSSPGLKSGLGVIVAPAISIVVVGGGLGDSIDDLEWALDIELGLAKDVDEGCKAEAGDAGVLGVEDVMNNAWTEWSAMRRRKGAEGVDTFIFFVGRVL